MKFIVITWTFIISVLMWTPLPPGDPSPLGHLDLVIHLGLFFTLSHLVKGWVGPDQNRFYWIDWGIIVLGFAVLFETGQWFVPGRSVSVLDYAVNGLAVMAGGCATTNLEHWEKILCDLATGGLSLLVGFGGIFYGGALFSLFKGGTPPVNSSSIILVGVILIGWVAYNLIRFDRQSDRWFLQWLLLPGILMTVSVTRPWSFVLCGVGLFVLITSSVDRIPILSRPLTRMFITIYAFSMAGSLVTIQQFLDGFGGIWVAVNLGLLGLIPLHRSWSHKPIPQTGSS